MNAPPADREILTWEINGQACRELAQAAADDGFEPDIILGIARGGLIPALQGRVAQVRNAVLYKRPHTITTPDYHWRVTDKWIEFPWSAPGPVVSPPA
ncbi:phosphoribosyltransferase [Gordonia bronchialis]|uniref:phosphoribosyltransferase n=1 Tax=Gordonia bronchialis TaxID=2054 RepID=UPI00242ED5B0|nr:hypothetical protein [Gordonia bronchialis]